MEILNAIYNFFFDFENKEPFNAAQDLNVIIVGLVLVFCALVLLAAIVSLLPKFLSRGKKAEKEKTTESAPVIEAELTIAEEANKETEEDEEELIAVLTAAIMSYYGNETKCNLKVTSFKRIDNASSTWSHAGRRDNLDASL